VPVDVYDEYTGLDRFSGPAYEEALVGFYREKYSTKTVDLLVVEGPAAMALVSAGLLPGVPVVTCDVVRSWSKIRMVNRLRRQSSRTGISAGAPRGGLPAR
jgi:hypothetical protein